MRRSFLSTVAVAALVAAVGCGSSSPSAKPGAAASGGVPTAPAAAASSSAPARAGSRGTGSTPALGTNGATKAPSGSTAKPQQPVKPTSTSVVGVPQAPAEELPIEAKINPGCVARGTAATMTVHTVAKAAIAYVAVYAGNKSGAAPPWGEGYGGNDRGEADGSGNWTTTWTVTPTAPTGKAHVVLVVGAHGQQRQVDVPFSVGEREVGGCGT